MFALRQMMTLTLMMMASPNDVASLMFFGKHRLIFGVAEYIIFAKQMHHFERRKHHLTVRSISFYLRTQNDVMLRINNVTPCGVNYVCLRQAILPCGQLRGEYHFEPALEKHSRLFTVLS